MGSTITDIAMTPTTASVSSCLLATDLLGADLQSTVSGVTVLGSVRFVAWQVEPVAPGGTAVDADVAKRHPEYPATTQSPEPGIFGRGHLGGATPMTGDASTVVDPVPGRQM